MDLSHLIIFPDIAKLPKSDLVNLATDLQLDTVGTAFDLANRIWKNIKEKTNRKEIYSKYSNKLLAGRTSVSWYTLDNLYKLKDFIIEKETVNPFKKRIDFNLDKIDSAPRLRSAAQIDSSKYFLRFIYQDGIRRIIGEDIEVLPTNKTATVYVDEEMGIIEIRARADDTERIAQAVASYLKQHLSLNHEDFIKPFGYDLESIADRLDGTLSGSRATPELWLDSYANSEIEEILGVLEGLDNYFETEELGYLQEKLDSASTVLGEELTDLPFIAIILAGMGNVGLQVNEDDLRKTAFYRLLKPHMQTSSGNIKFSLDVDGIDSEFTIQVGIQSKTIYFRSNNTTEEVMEYVRNRIIR